LMFDTPVDEEDRLDARPIFQTVQEIASSLADGATVWVTSQVPVGTCDVIREKIAALRPGLDFGVAYSPENLRLGQALEAFRKPALPVLGADETQTHERMEKILAVWGVPYRRVTLKTAEMTKHALNAFLASCVTFGGELGNLCDALGADAIEVAKALRLEPRVGPRSMILPGLGFAGGTLARDVQVLRGFGDHYGVETHYLDGVWSANQYQNGLVIRRLEKWFPSLKDLRVTVWGLTYKAGTSTLRRSAALDLIHHLKVKGAVVRAHDPKADRSEVQRFTDFAFFEDPYEAAQDADVLVVMTGWEDYRKLDFSE
jgi:UDPglucose 6-dehydrogenase